MSYNVGYVTIPHSTYDEWRNATNGNGYNFDNMYGCQCYDLAVEFWWNVGFPQGYPTSQGSGNAWQIWSDRLNNVAYGGTTYFDLITNLDDIKRGDVIVYNYYTGNPYGHIGFADDNYASWHANNPGSYEFPILSENNGGTPDPQGGAYTNVHGYDIRLFLGAFRYRAWHTTPPTPPTPVSGRSKFPWVLYARKLRNKRNGL